MLPLPCMLACNFVCANRTRDRGCSKHPVFPAPSISKRAKRRCKPRAISAARSRRYVIRRMGRAKRNPSSRAPTLMGFASLYPSCGTEIMFNRYCKRGARSPDERSDIRGHSHTVPDVAALIQATKPHRTAKLPPARATETAANPAAGKARASSPSIFPARRYPSPHRARRAGPAPAVGASQW